MYGEVILILVAPPSHSETRMKVVTCGSCVQRRCCHACLGSVNYCTVLYRGGLRAHQRMALLFSQMLRWTI